MKVAKQVNLVVVLGLVLVLLLAGCARAAPTPAPAPIPTPAPKPTPTPITTPTLTGPYGQLSFGMASFQTGTLDPIKGTSSNNWQLCKAIFDFAIIKGMDGQSAPGVLEKWEMAGDGLSWTFYLRKGIKFHNGDDLTAKDLKFSIERYMGADAMQPDLRRNTERVELVDDYTVRAYTKGLQIFYDGGISHKEGRGQGMVMPKNYIERYGVEYFARYPIGSGPFRFVRYVPGDVVEYEALDKNWRIVPEFKKLALILMPEETTRIASLRTGVIDATDVSLEMVAGLEQAGFRTISTADWNPCISLHGVFQEGAGPIGDLRVRRALSLAINRDEIIKTFFLGKALPPNPPGVGELSAVDVPYWKEYAAKIYRYDPVEAKRLLKEAGYPDGFNIKLWSMAVPPSNYLPKLAEIVQSYWLKMGVKAELVPVDYGAFRSFCNTLKSPRIIGDASIYRIGNGWSGGSRNMGQSYLSTYHSESPLALLGKSSPEGDRLSNNYASEPDAKKRLEMADKMVKIVVDSYVSLVIASVPEGVAIGPRVDLVFPKGESFVGSVAELAKHRK